MEITTLIPGRDQACLCRDRVVFFDHGTITAPPRALSRYFHCMKFWKKPFFLDFYLNICQNLYFICLFKGKSAKREHTMYIINVLINQYLIEIDFFTKHVHITWAWKMNKIIKKCLLFIKSNIYFLEYFIFKSFID